MRKPTEMELRVIKATCDGFGLMNLETGRRWEEPCSWPKCGCGNGPVEDARKAIRAMRQPTDKMLRAVYDSSGEGLSYPNGYREHFWTVMIDAASPPGSKT